MGASGSKPTTSAIRKFPTRAPGSKPPIPSARPPRASPASQTPSSSRTAEATEACSTPVRPAAEEEDAQTDDAPPSQDFANRLQKMGIAQPNPIFSPSSTANVTPSSRNADVVMNPRDFAAPQFPAASNNVTLGVLEARRALEQRATQEFDRMGKPGYQGREFLDIMTIRNILVMRQRGDSPSDIETRLRLKPGLVARLGRAGIVEPAV
ncbi:hypothetical protein QBC37DRAFT_395959 [Rhypophila decipiens]|uniref:Helix-turn-helix domain-containing protein n=1 Tax=Rhypophila decipiens TaxID=261697 RepID=A0AAN7BBW9_9PEZI|nr:hypothetical protein QBC37DRAFT_395959 [Rhypophila decipiens]